MALKPEPPFRCECFPLPGVGRHPATQAATNLRIRPTVTSYLSRRKSLTVVGYEGDDPAARLNVPPATSGLRAQTSFEFAPQLFKPSPTMVADVAVL